ncbi:MAG: hypothetical protein JW703_01050 [Candidatus Diapherotrites archaeon]|nr:hypothetical protein [Candidatus Diapherotrites archaeon]
MGLFKKTPKPVGYKNPGFASKLWNRIWPKKTKVEKPIRLQDRSVDYAKTFSEHKKNVINPNNPNAVFAIESIENAIINPAISPNEKIPLARTITAIRIENVKEHKDYFIRLSVLLASIQEKKELSAFHNIAKEKIDLITKLLKS